MGILREGSNCFQGGWSAAAIRKPCELCRSTAALLFCHTDNMFICLACDTRVHENARHERVWMCEVCEQAAASITCKADAAALCVTCDRDIHSANPLAQRHERIPVVPFYDAVESVVKSTAATLLVSINNSNAMSSTTTAIPNCKETTIFDSKVPACMGHHEEEFVTDPWFATDTVSSKLSPEMKPVDFLFSDSDSFLDFDCPVSVDNTYSQRPHYNSANDSVVPVQSTTTIKPLVVPFNNQEKQFEIDFTQSHIKTYTAPSLSHSVSSSSMDVGVVPDGSSISDISHPFCKNMNSSGINQGEKLTGMDREARVLRYREKKKNRKFEKTIRYASRKAYAETRPRIKGRFAKRNDGGAGIDSDIDQIFPGVDFISPDLRYGVVPSF